MAACNEKFEKHVLDQLQGNFQDLAHLRDSLVASSSTAQSSEAVVQKVDDVLTAMWATRVEAVQYKRLVYNQVRRVSTILVKEVKKKRPSGKREKSKARQDAGKVKAESLTPWHNDCRDARKALKERGYEGSVKLCRGGEVYKQVQSIRRARLLSTTTLAAGSSDLVAASEGSAPRRRLRRAAK